MPKLFRRLTASLLAASLCVDPAFAAGAHAYGRAPLRQPQSFSRFSAEALTLPLLASQFTRYLSFSGRAARAQLIELNRREVVRGFEWAGERAELRFHSSWKTLSSKKRGKSLFSRIRSDISEALHNRWERISGPQWKTWRYGAAFGSLSSLALLAYNFSDIASEYESRRALIGKWLISIHFWVGDLFTNMGWSLDSNVNYSVQAFLLPFIGLWVTGTLYALRSKQPGFWRGTFFSASTLFFSVAFARPYLDSLLTLFRYPSQFDFTIGVTMLLEHRLTSRPVTFTVWSLTLITTVALTYLAHSGLNRMMSPLARSIAFTYRRWKTERKPAVVYQFPTPSSTTPVVANQTRLDPTTAPKPELREDPEIARQASLSLNTSVVRELHQFALQLTDQGLRALTTKDSKDFDTAAARLNQAEGVLKEIESRGAFTPEAAHAAVDVKSHLQRLKTRVEAEQKIRVRSNRRASNAELQAAQAAEAREAQRARDAQILAARGALQAERERDKKERQFHQLLDISERYATALNHHLTAERAERERQAAEVARALKGAARRLIDLKRVTLLTLTQRLEAAITATRQRDVDTKAAAARAEEDAELSRLVAEEAAQLADIQKALERGPFKGVAPIPDDWMRVFPALLLREKVSAPDIAALSLSGLITRRIRPVYSETALNGPLALGAAAGRRSVKLIDEVLEATKLAPLSSKQAREIREVLQSSVPDEQVISRVIDILDSEAGPSTTSTNLPWMIGALVAWAAWPYLQDIFQLIAHLGPANHSSLSLLSATLIGGALPSPNTDAPPLEELPEYHEALHTKIFMSKLEDKTAVDMDQKSPDRKILAALLGWNQQWKNREDEAAGQKHRVAFHSRQNIAHILWKDGRAADALQELQEAQTLYGNPTLPFHVRVRFWMTLAYTQASLGQFDEADATLAEALLHSRILIKGRMDPQNPIPKDELIAIVKKTDPSHNTFHTYLINAVTTLESSRRLIQSQRPRSTDSDAPPAQEQDDRLEEMPEYHEIIAAHYPIEEVLSQATSYTPKTNPSNQELARYLAYNHQLRDRALELDRSMEQILVARHNAAMIYRHLNRVEDAIAELEAGNESFHRDAHSSYLRERVWILLGRLYVRTGRRTEAETVFRKGLAFASSMLNGFTQGRGDERIPIPEQRILEAKDSPRYFDFINAARAARNVFRDELFALLHPEFKNAASLESVLERAGKQLDMFQKNIPQLEEIITLLEPYLGLPNLEALDRYQIQWTLTRLHLQLSHDEQADAWAVAADQTSTGIAVPLIERLQLWLALGMMRAKQDNTTDATRYFSQVMDVTKDLLAQRPRLPSMEGVELLKPEWNLARNKQIDFVAKLRSIARTAESELAALRLPLSTPQPTSNGMNAKARKAEKDRLYQLEKAQKLAVREGIEAVRSGNLELAQEKLKTAGNVEGAEKLKDAIHAFQHEQNWQRILTLARPHAVSGDQIVDWLEKQGLLKREDSTFDDSLFEFKTPEELLTRFILPLEDDTLGPSTTRSHTQAILDGTKSFNEVLQQIEERKIEFARAEAAANVQSRGIISIERAPAPRPKRAYIPPPTRETPTVEVVLPPETPPTPQDEQLLAIARALQEGPFKGIDPLPSDWLTAFSEQMKTQNVPVDRIKQLSVAELFTKRLQPALLTILLYGPLAAGASAGRRPVALVDATLALTNTLNPTQSKGIRDIFASNTPDDQVEEKVFTFLSSGSPAQTRHTKRLWNALVPDSIKAPALEAAFTVIVEWTARMSILFLLLYATKLVIGTITPLSTAPIAAWISFAMYLEHDNTTKRLAGLWIFLAVLDWISGSLFFTMGPLIVIFPAATGLFAHFLYDRTEFSKRSKTEPPLPQRPSEKRAVIPQRVPPTTGVWVINRRTQAPAFPVEQLVPLSEKRPFPIVTTPEQQLSTQEKKDLRTQARAQRDEAQRRRDQAIESQARTARERAQAAKVARESSIRENVQTAFPMVSTETQDTLFALFNENLRPESLIPALAQSLAGYERLVAVPEKRTAEEWLNLLLSNTTSAELSAKTRELFAQDALRRMQPGTTEESRMALAKEFALSSKDFDWLPTQFSHLEPVMTEPLSAPAPGVSAEPAQEPSAVTETTQKTEPVKLRDILDNHRRKVTSILRATQQLMAHLENAPNDYTLFHPEEVAALLKAFPFPGYERLIVRFEAARAHQKPGKRAHVRDIAALIASLPTPQEFARIHLRTLLREANDIRGRLRALDQETFHTNERTLQVIRERTGALEDQLIATRNKLDATTRTLREWEIPFSDVIAEEQPVKPPVAVEDSIRELAPEPQFITSVQAGMPTPEVSAIDPKLTEILTALEGGKKVEFQHPTRGHGTVNHYSRGYADIALDTGGTVKFKLSTAYRWMGIVIRQSTKPRATTEETPPAADKPVKPTKNRHPNELLASKQWASDILRTLTNIGPAMKDISDAQVLSEPEEVRESVVKSARILVELGTQLRALLNEMPKVSFEENDDIMAPLSFISRKVDGTNALLANPHLSYDKDFGAIRLRISGVKPKINTWIERVEAAAKASGASSPIAAPTIEKPRHRTIPSLLLRQAERLSSPFGFPMEMTRDVIRGITFGATPGAVRFQKVRAATLSHNPALDALRKAQAKYRAAHPQQTPSVDALKSKSALEWARRHAGSYVPESISGIAKHFLLDPRHMARILKRFRVRTFNPMGNDPQLSRAA